MQHISIIEPATKEAVKAFAEKHNLTEHIAEDYHHPQEDYLLNSENPPIFVVSDGVTLNFKKFIETNTKYPSPSPAGDVARIFCETVVQSVKEKYQLFGENSLVEVFREANSKVGGYNQKVGKSEVSGNPTGLYSATGSFVVIKDSKAYWLSICDAYVAHFDKDMNRKFISSGVCRPYAVINGEERMANHLETGIFNLDAGDRIFVFTDGFEGHVKNPEFLKLFTEWGSDLKERISTFSAEMNSNDPEHYGHERSLIAILV